MRLSASALFTGKAGGARQSETLASVRHPQTPLSILQEKSGNESYLLTHTYYFPRLKVNRSDLESLLSSIHFPAGTRRKMTSCRRRCDVITSHRCRYDIILAPFVHWGLTNVLEFHFKVECHLLHKQIQCCMLASGCLTSIQQVVTRLSMV